MVSIWIWKNGTNWLLRTGIWSSCHSSYSLSSIFARISHVLVTECPVVSGTDWNLIETLNSFKMNSLQSSHFSHLNYEVAIKSTFFSLSTLNSVKMVWKWLYGKLYWWKRNENTLEINNLRTHFLSWKILIGGTRVLLRLIFCNFLWVLEERTIVKSKFLKIN